MYVCTSNIKFFTAFDSLFGDDNLKLTLLLSRSRTGCFDIALDYCLHISLLLKHACIAFSHVTSLAEIAVER